MQSEDAARAARIRQLHSVLVAGVVFVWLSGPVGAQAVTATSPVSGDATLQELWNHGEFTEGVAVAPDGTIFFSDIPRGDLPGRILKFDPVTKQTSVFVADSGKSNGLMFDRDGRLIACCGSNGGLRSLCRVTPEGEVQVLVDRFEGHRLNSPNDLVIHPDGGVFFSDPRYIGGEPIDVDHMSVYRYNPAGDVLTRVTSDISKPNGLALSPDGRTLYVAETDNAWLDARQTAPENLPVRMTLNAFPLRKDGSLGKRRVLVDFGRQLGVDGMTVDREGRIYAAVRSDERFGIVVYSPDGKELAYISTPSLPTNCCFGSGENASTLYVTAGGGLYGIRLNAQGYHPAKVRP